MKTQINCILIIAIFLLNSCSEQHKKTNQDMFMKFEEFRNKDKFIPDDNLFYPGIAYPELKPILSKKINLAADDFEKLAAKGATNKEYQQAIKEGLMRFSDIYIELDTEDRDRVCSYFEELMDIVGLESSGGYLNKFAYGFDFLIAH